MVVLAILIFLHHAKLAKNAIKIAINTIGVTIMSTNPIFKNLDNKYEWYAYTRIGLYYTTRSGKRINICDVHLGGLGPESMSGGFYTGPKNSPDQIKTFKRSEQEVFWGDHWDDGSDPDNLGLSGGGLAHALSPKNSNKLHLWLYGPIMLNRVPYGSLVAVLYDMEFPKRKPYKLIDDQQRANSDSYKAESEHNPFQIIFPRGYRSRHYRKCVLWGNMFYPGETQKLWGPPGSDLNKALKEAWKKKYFVPLPKPVMKMAWKIEDCASGLTMAQLHNRRG